MTIRKLDESLVVRIAAGEVIERPASVVKELVENAFDAGARTVVVRLERGGLGLIEVADDGCGIPSAELPIAIERHATSKIAVASDLERIRTMGFRGEALAAIASAGRLSIVSRVADGEAARLEIGDDYSPENPGKGLRIEPAARARGTTVTVHDLFARTPARLKFMKSPTAELGRISDILERLAFARPDVAVELVREGRRVFRTDGTGNLRDAVRAIYGPNIASALIDVEASTPAGSLSGLVSAPQLTRRNRTGIHLHVCGRPFEDRTVLHAVTAAYDGILPSGHFPVAFLGLAIDPSEVDVNVHPAKAEVRFRDTAAIHRLVSHGVRAHLRAGTPLPTFGALPSREHAPAPERSTGTDLARVNDDSIRSSRSSADGVRAVAANSIARHVPSRGLEESPPVLPLPELAPRALRIRYLGEIAGRYLICEDDEGLVLIDQHAAHERVLFDRLRAAAAAGTPELQPLLAPIVIELPPTERALAEEHLGDFAAIGFEIESWPGAIALRAIPAHFRHVADAASLLKETLERLRESGDDGPRSAASHDRLARAACKAAVKGTERLAPEEARRLVADLAATDDPYTCPHGRPTMVRLTLPELDRRFGRV